MYDSPLYIQVLDLKGKLHRLDALSGWSVMEIIRDAGLPGLKAECGGTLACATCHVYVDSDWADRLDVARDDEHNMIIDFATAPHATSRLSCQIIMRDDLNGLTVTIASNPD